jgi:hypothetical protein
MKSPRRLAVALVVLLTSTTCGHAAPHEDAAGAAGSLWDAARTGTEGLWTAAGSLFAALDPLEYLPEQMPDRDRRFLALMQAAGYRLAAIDTDEGLFGRVRYRFEQQRTPSPDDLERVRLGLVEYRARHSGSVALTERRALIGLLAVSAAPSFRVDVLKLDVRPWPTVSFHVIPRDRIITSAP